MFRLVLFLSCLFFVEFSLLLLLLLLFMFSSVTPEASSAGARLPRSDEAVSFAVAGGLASLCVWRIPPPCQTFRGARSASPVVSVAAHGARGGLFSFSGRSAPSFARKRFLCAVRRSCEDRRGARRVLRRERVAPREPFRSPYGRSALGRVSTRPGRPGSRGQSPVERRELPHASASVGARSPKGRRDHGGAKLPHPVIGPSGPPVCFSDSSGAERRSGSLRPCFSQGAFCGGA